MESSQSQAGKTPMKAGDITDLRTALDFLAQIPGQLVSTKVEVDPYLELAGVYRRVGSGTPTAPPTQIGPAMLFENVKGHDMSVVAGVLASRERTALLLGSTKERLMFDLLAALDRPVPPVVVPAAEAPCQEVVIKPPFDLREVIPPIISTTKRRGALLQHGPAPSRGPRDRGLRRHHPPHVHPRARQHERQLHPGPAHRRLPPEGRGDGQAPARLGEHRLRSGHLRGHLVRSPDHAAGLRRADHRRRAARTARWSWSSASRSRRRPSPGPRSSSRASSGRANMSTRTRSPGRGWAMPEFPGYVGQGSAPSARLARDGDHAPHRARSSRSWSAPARST